MLCVLFFCVNLWEIERTLSMRLGLWDLLGSFFSHRTHRFNRTYLRTVSNAQNASGIQISQNVIAKGGCWVMSGRCWWLAKTGVGWWMLAVRFCEIGWLNVSVKVCVFCSSVIFCERKIVGYSQWGVLSLTERTEFTEHFGAHFEPTERLRHTENTEAFQLTLAVTLCVIGWLNVSVKVCVFCSSV